MAMELFESCLKRDEGGCVVAPRLSQTSCTTTVEALNPVEYIHTRLSIKKDHTF